MKRFIVFVFLSALSVLVCTTGVAAEPAEVFALWPAGKMPGESRTDPKQPEQLVTSRRRTFDQFTNISTPKLAFFPADPSAKTGAAVLVMPGGGLQRLAYQHEGEEIAEWLNPLGLSVFVLKYRVPAPSTTALMDAQRAMGFIRQKADEFGIDPERLGTMGFSAGGEVGLLLALNRNDRGYEPVDETDTFSCQPTSSCLVYPGGIARRNGELRPDIASDLETKDLPPTFIVHAVADASMNSLALAMHLKRRDLPFEMHLYQEGGHGFGARSTNLPLNSWKQRYTEWIAAQGFFDPPFVSRYTNILLSGPKEPARLLPRLTELYPQASLEDAYAIQRKFVAAERAQRGLAGFKAGLLTKAAQDANGVDGPVTGVLFGDGRIAESGNPAESGKPASTLISVNRPTAIETELGLIVSDGLDISTRVETVDQIRGAFEAIVPVIEVPDSLADRFQGEVTVVDVAAANVGSARYLLGSQQINPDNYDPDTLSIVLTKDGQLLHQVEGDSANHGIWEHMRRVVNQIVDQGYTIHSGDLIICGAIGSVHPALPGRYMADYGSLGTIAFEIEQQE